MRSGLVIALVLAFASSASAQEKMERVDGIGDYWESEGAFGAFRRWREAAAEPCRSCEYLALCRGGCRVVSAHVMGDAGVSDPECPRVVDYFKDRPQRVRLPLI